MNHGRLHWYEPDELTGDQRQVYDRVLSGPRRLGSGVGLTDDAGRLHGPFNAMLAAPRVGLPMQELGAAIRYRGTLSDRERELAILMVAARWRSEFEWAAHELVAHRAGLDGSQTNAIAAGLTPERVTESETTVIDVVRSLIERNDLDSALFQRAVDQLGVEKVVETVGLVGYYEMLALSLRVFRVPLRVGAERRWATEDRAEDTE